MTGILLVDKPAEWTSMDVCAHLRGVLHEKHIGHTGTLDPNATGLLVVLVGKATKLSKYLEADQKEYRAVLRTGLRTDTQDIWGTVLEENAAVVSQSEMEKVLPVFRGDILQIPPMYSAIKIRGQKLYQVARRGKEIEREPRPITIYNLQLLSGSGRDWSLAVECSKGTYIRTLCADIGDALGCGAAMAALRRVRAGRFTLGQAHTLEQIRRNPEMYLLPAEELVEEFNDRK